MALILKEFLLFDFERALTVICYSLSHLVSGLCAPSSILKISVIESLYLNQLSGWFSTFYFMMETDPVLDICCFSDH
jgi:hypothetical protein